MSRNDCWFEYLGTLTLLGEFISGQELSASDRLRVDNCFAAANRNLEARDSKLRFQRSMTGGWAAFPIDPKRPS